MGGIEVGRQAGLVGGGNPAAEPEDGGTYCDDPWTFGEDPGKGKAFECVDE